MIVSVLSAAEVSLQGRRMEVRGADKCGVGTAAGKRRSGQGKSGNWFPARYVRMVARKKQVGHNSKYVRPVSKYLGHISAPVETRRQYVAEVRMKRGRMPAARPCGKISVYVNMPVLRIPAYREDYLCPL